MEELPHTLEEAIDIIEELEARIENILSGIPYSAECFKLRERNEELEAWIEKTIEAGADSGLVRILRGEGT